MKFIKLVFAKLRQLSCNHVYIDLLKIGRQGCIFCGKERPKEFKSNH